MTIARWNPPVAPTRREQFLLKRLGRARKLFGFLRVHRHELFHDAFQDELASMYRGRRERCPGPRDDGHGDAGTRISGHFRRRNGRVDGRRPARADGAGVPRFRGARVLSRRVAGVSGTADRRRPRSSRARITVELAKRTKAFDPRNRDTCNALRSAAWSNSIPTCAIAVPCARNA